MDFELAPRTLYLAVTGSHAYGMATPESDVDIRGVAVAPRRYYTGFMRRFQQADGAPPGFWSDGKGIGPLALARSRRAGVTEDAVRQTTDVQITDIQKFCALAADANPNVLEQLFLPDRCVLHLSGWFEQLIVERDLFLSTKVRHTFAGYAHSQIKRIRGHRAWLLSPPKAPPERKDFGLPEENPMPGDQWRAAESMIQRRIEDWSFNPEEETPVTVLTRVREAMTDLVASVARDQDPEAVTFRAAGRQLGFDDNFLQLLDAERKYRAAKRHWQQYQTWLRERNPARAELEAKYGYDTKHASHVVRLTRMCEEVLTTGKLHVDRSARDGAELLAIRHGAWSYDKLEEFAESIDRRMDVLYKDPACPLPKQPNRNRIDELCAGIVEHFPAT